MVTADALTFDPVSHAYFFAGVQIPSVTEILRATGVAFDYTSINGILSREQLAEKRAIGTALHADAHAFDDNDLDWETVDPRVAPYLNAWIEFRQAQKWQPVARERRVFHPIYRYAGTLDGIFEKKPGGPRVLIDLKTGSVEESACRYQTAAYLAAYKYEEDRRYTKDHNRTPHLIGLDRMAVQLEPLSSPPYKVTLYSRRDQMRDFRTFQAFLTTYRHQFHRRKVAA